MSGCAMDVQGTCSHASEEETRARNHSKIENFILPLSAYLKLLVYHCVQLNHFHSENFCVSKLASVNCYQERGQVDEQMQPVLCHSLH